MYNPFDHLPYNTNRAYVMVVLPGGCELYVPTKSNNYQSMDAYKKSLQKYVNQEYPEPPPSAA